MNTSISQIINQKILLNFKAYLLRHYNVGIEKKLYRQTELQLIGVITLIISIY